ncbi:MAG: D-glycero-beta-D-manno-heptose 1-phosphate adenylyltransferase [Nanoarchaeota archaeon]|nr:D-glycero-beta-D-manno-heptose 1-phosphate adenylyltransferase [Nanoarchaeota archaeon]
MEFKQKKKIAVIGDVMLDEFIFGDVTRINPEAPVPVLEFERSEYRLGGAANVANNIFSLGGHCVLIGRIGKEKRIKKILEGKNIHYDFIENESIPTITKTRMMVGTQHLLRLDRETKLPITSKDVKKIVKKVRNIDIIVISDYAKGMITQELMDELRKLNKIILADPKITKPELFKDVYLIKPNLEETKKSLHVDVKEEKDVELAGKLLQKKYHSNILITRGKEGMSLFEKGEKPFHVPTTAREVYEVSGAGDTVIATIAIALGSEKNLEEAVILSNKAAGIVVGKIGTATVTKKELSSKMDKENLKIKTRKEIKEITKDLKNKNKKIVFTNGRFDILHLGHIDYLSKAKSFGDKLIIGLNTDISVRKIKGKNRPFTDENSRATILASLLFVDAVILFDEETPYDLIKFVQPDVLIKGGDYKVEDIVGYDIVKDSGGKIETLDLLEGYSTSLIEEKV